MLMPIPAARVSAAASTGQTAGRATNADTAAAFETAFLAEMLNAAKVVREPEAFGGGFGAEMFSSLLGRAYAEQIGKAGGLGIADQVRERIAQGGT